MTWKSGVWEGGLRREVEREIDLKQARLFDRSNDRALSLLAFFPSLPIPLQLTYTAHNQSSAGRARPGRRG